MHTKYYFANNLFIILCYTFLNFSLIKITNSFSITAAFFFPFWVFFSGSNPTIKIQILIPFLIATIYPIIPIIVYQDEFILPTIYLLYIYSLCSIFVVLCIRYRYRKPEFSLSIQSTSYLLVALLLIQFFEFFINKSYRSVSIFSPFLLYENSYYIKLLDIGFFRGAATYFEPSFCALVLVSLWVSLSQLKNTTIIHDLLIGLVLLLTKSISGIILYSGLLFLKHILIDISFSKIAKKIIPFLCIFLVISSPILSRIFSNKLDPSIYYRLIAPLFVAREVFSEFPLGLPFGTLYEYVNQFQLMNGNEIGRTIDNGYYYILIHFSWVGILLTLSFIAFTSSKIILPTKSIADKYLYFYLLLAPCFTGAIFSPEFLFLILLPCFIHREVKRYRETIYHYGLLQRLTRTDQNS